MALRGQARTALVATSISAAIPTGRSRWAWVGLTGIAQGLTFPGRRFTLMPVAGGVG